MHGTRGTGNIRNAALIVVAAIALSGCLGKEDESKSDKEIAADNRLIGSVGDGPVVGALMSIRRSDGKMLAALESDANANYYVLVQTKGQHYPLTVVALGGIDLVTNDSPDFDLVGAVLGPGDLTVANVNPFTTLIVEIARELPGGLNSENIVTAESFVTAALSSGLSTLINEGPMRAGIDGSNIAEMVKAAESLAEIVRRTRDLHLLYGRSTSGNQVLRALASDLTDTIVDGRGSVRTEPRTAAIATVAAVLVYLESMQNELRVNGQNAMGAMDAAITQVSDTNPSKMVGDIVVTNEMIDAVRLGLVACLAVDDGPKIQELIATFDGVQSGMDAVLIRTLMPDDYIQTLEAILAMIAGADDSVIDTINTVVRTGLDDPTINQTPTISGNPATSIVAGSSYSFAPTAADPEGDTLTFTIVNRPAWASFSTSTGQLSGTPTTGNIGSFNNIVIGVTDGEFSPSLPTFSINVVRDNSAPSISGSPSTQVSANSSYSFTPSASDPDNDTLTFSVSGLPVWASFRSSDGRILGTPTDANVGTYSNIRITVSDGIASASLAPFSITVTATTTNSPPSISGNPPTQVNANSQYYFVPSASDPEGDTLTFSITGLPGWGQFRNSDGRIKGTPTVTDAGTYSNIRITVSDGSASVSLPPFSITVISTTTNSPPSISGNPPTQASTNVQYTFTPLASDPDNDTLTFSVTGLPGWADFNNSTGSVMGTPTDANVGVYTNIQITVSDGSASASLASFSITVNAVSLGSVTLSWTPPTQNEDGSELVDLAGYKIRWGTTPGSYPNWVLIDNPGLSTYVVDNLAPGTYEFVATSINASGVESVYSNTATKIVN